MRPFFLLFVLALSGTALAAPGDADEPASDTSSQGADAAPPEPVGRARATSATRLRAMLGAHAKGPALPRAELVQAIDPRHPKVQSLVQAVRAARAERLRARFYDVTLSSDTKAAVDGYYGYVISDNSLAVDAGALRVEGGYRLGVDAADGSLPDYYGEYETLRGGEVRLQVGVDLLEGLITDPDRTALRQADRGIDLAQADLELTELLVLRDGVAAWSKWVASGRILNLDEALLDVARQRQDAVEQRIGLGDLAPIERVRNRQIVAAREADLADAQGDFTAATEKLALYLRDQDGGGIRASRARLPDRVSAPSGAPSYDVDPVELALREHPLLRAARARLDLTDLDRRLARFGILPELRVTGQVSQDVQGGGQPSDSLSPRVAMVGAKIKVPIANTKDRGKRRMAEAKFAKAKADLAWLEDQVVADVRAAVAREQAALERWRRTSESVDLALQLQDAEQRRFDVGDIDLLRLWQVEQQTAKAIREEVKAWQSYQIAVAELELAVGKRLE